MGRAEKEVYGYIHLPCRVEVNARIAAVRPAPLLETRLG
jgi:hypothetical protein